MRETKDMYLWRGQTKCFYTFYFK